VTGIRNVKQLMNNSKSALDRKARRLVLSSIEAALNAVDPRDIIRAKVSLKGNVLRICGHPFDLGEFRNIIVVGGGKASGLMAEALEKILEDRITNGIVNIPYDGVQLQLQHIRLQEASHPVPDEASVRGVKRIIDLATSADERDLIICLISGGGSSLMPLPRRGISLQDKIMVTDQLLKSGATIDEINTVRKHISDFKGGWLAKRAYPTTVVNLILSDVIGDALDSIASGPTVPDTTTFRDAVKILKRYMLWSRVAESVREVLLKGEKGLIPETPKADDETFKKVHNFIVANNRSASLAAYEKLKRDGLNTLFLTSQLEGEARHVGTVFAAIVKEIIESGKPICKPAGIVAGGETTVTVAGGGKGGRNQELVLSASLRLEELEGIAIASVSTDGVDGPTDAAGAIADGQTVKQARNMRLDPLESLINNDSYGFFSRVHDLIFTGPTGTNVNDLTAVVVL